ncbi:MAG: hypothetical protein IJZ89_02190 [Clostridia bacterium]|nr:hypothetical protein [Clostridia bacterium]
MESLFKSVGFEYEYYDEMIDLYKKYFLHTDNMFVFFIKVFKNDKTNKTPRRMMNQVQRFVSLANDIERIRPGKDDLILMFIRICLESLCNLSKENKSTFFDNYPCFFSQDGCKYILENFKLTEVNKSDDQDYNCFRSNNHSCDISLNDFFLLIKSVRNQVVHDGVYGSMQFFSRTGYPLITTYTTTDSIINNCPYKNKCWTYTFETTLNYDRFIYYFVEACINYIGYYIDTLMI